ncbi:WW domain-containing protein [Carex littledalei]|uniref:WW domain-containing protein n=1 Tax=Carex littledalei TaxID=544730 RepID=A0A833QQX1_9POAL|nr:WW domain-containing protein [Carex littledalei]
MMQQETKEPLYKIQPELSLGPSLSSHERCERSCSSESDEITSRKRRKQVDFSDDHVELHLGRHEPLPLHWEQCLDLESGRIYYMNRKTLKKSWVRPKEHILDLELNISTRSTPDGNKNSVTRENPERIMSPAGNMVAIACANCHLLVMLSKSSPSCPNCKFMHSLLPVMPQPPPPRKIQSVKSLETLSLLH